MDQRPTRTAWAASLLLPYQIVITLPRVVSNSELVLGTPTFQSDSIYYDTDAKNITNIYTYVYIQLHIGKLYKNAIGQKPAEPLVSPSVVCLNLDLLCTNSTIYDVICLFFIVQNPRLWHLRSL